MPKKIHRTVDHSERELARFGRHLLLLLDRHGGLRIRGAKRQKGRGQRSRVVILRDSAIDECDSSGA